MIFYIGAVLQIISEAFKLMKSIRINQKIIMHQGAARAPVFELRSIAV